MPSRILWAHDCRSEPEPISAATARDFVRRHLAAHQLPYLIEDIQLVVSDLVTNAHRNARTPVSITLEAMPFGVTLTVQAQLAPPQPRMPLDELMAETWPGGLRLVELLSTDWGVDSAGADQGGIRETTWATFPIQPVLMTTESVKPQVPDTSWSRPSGRAGEPDSPTGTGSEPEDAGGIRVGADHRGRGRGAPGDPGRYGRLVRSLGSGPVTAHQHSGRLPGQAAASRPPR